MNIVIGNRIGRKGGQSWSSYWAHSNLLLFFGQIKNITGGRLYNEVTGATDYLTVAGAVGSYTFQCPNDATYIAADTDYIWFKTDTTQRTTTEAELVTYDLQRTPVKFDDNAPYTIRWIAILKSTTTLTSTQRDNLFKGFDLPILWDNNYNDYGHLKESRIWQNLWTPEAVYDAASIALFARMDALGESPTDARKTNIDTTIKALKTANLFDTRFDALWVGRGTGIGSTKLNWIQNAFNLTKVGAGVLTFTSDLGYNSDDATTALTTNYKPSVNGDKYKQNDASFWFKCSGTFDTTGSYGAVNNPRLLHYQTSHRINCDTSGGTNGAVGYNCLSRSSAANFQKYTNAATETVIAVSTGVPIDTVAILADYNEGATTYARFKASTEIWEMGGIGASMSQAEFLTLQTIMDNYISAL